VRIVSRVPSDGARRRAARGKPSRSSERDGTRLCTEQPFEEGVHLFDAIHPRLDDPISKTQAATVFVQIGVGVLMKGSPRVAREINALCENGKLPAPLRKIEGRLRVHPKSTIYRSSK